MEQRRWPGATLRANRPAANLSKGLIGPIADAPIAALWPETQGEPTPGDMIDYAGVTPNRLDMGFGYDDVPYGVKAPEVAVFGAPAPSPLAVFTNKSLSADERTAVASELQVSLKAQEVPAIATIVKDGEEAESIRVAAVGILGSLTDDSGLSSLLAVAGDANETSALKLAAVDAIGSLMMFAAIEEHGHHQVMAALNAALLDTGPQVRVAALRALASHRDPQLVQHLTSGLRDASTLPVSQADAILALVVAGAVPEHATLLRGFLASPDPGTKTAAVLALNLDPESHSKIVSLLKDRNEATQVRLAVLRGLSEGSPENVGIILELLKSSAEADLTKQAAAVTLTRIVETAGQKLNHDELNVILGQLRILSGGEKVIPGLNRTLEIAKKMHPNL
ncbi:hypothetical protein [Mesorhizobium sp. M0643]|uniref:HEAT repeat domain-containing protein n=1 Tax=Mesorhizobium sp. M0643 TaxID=2956978 RepID=UPI00333D068C